MRFAIAAAGLVAAVSATPQYGYPASSAAPVRNSTTSAVASGPQSMTSSYGASSAGAASATAYTTEVVTAYTTYCPYATQITQGTQTYTVTEATTLTITNCPCTITKPVYSSAPSAPAGAPSAPAYSSPAGGAPAPVYSSSAAAGKPSMPPAGGAPAPVYTSHPAAGGAGNGNGTMPTYSAPKYSSPAASSSTGPQAPVYTGAASKASFGVAGLLAAAGLVAAL